MSRKYQTLSPATGQVVKEFRGLSDREVESALDKANRRFADDWRFRPVQDRVRVLTKAAAILRERIDEYAGIVTLEMGKLISQSRAEVEVSAGILEYYAKHAEPFLDTKPVLGTQNTVIVTEPIGIILAIEPWNFPYYQLARVVGPQLAAGNVVVVKHSRNVPQAALAFEELLREAGAPEGVYTNLFIEFDQVNKIIDDFRVRGVTLTGSESAGAKVAERAGRALKKVVLELGGSDPFIVLSDADMEDAVRQGAEGRMAVTGQECVASKRFIIVGKERGHLFVEGLRKIFDSLKFGDPADESTTLGPLSSESARDTLFEQIKSAKAHGAHIVSGGKIIDRPGFYIEPAIITDIDEKNPLYYEETFGPVASIYVVDDEEEAIKLANATRYGLGASVFSKDIAHARAVATKIETGMVFINSPAVLLPDVPFGGIKNSGFGRELGELGIGEFVNRKVIRVAA